VWGLATGGYIHCIATPSSQLTVAERRAAAAAAEWASQSETQPWRIGDRQGGAGRGRPRRPRQPATGRRALAGLLALAAAGLVVYAAFFRGPAHTSSSWPLPEPGKVIEWAGSCRASVYPPGAEYRFQRCVFGRIPLGWPACSQVTYGVDASSAPAGYVPDLRGAISALRAATGLRLVPVAGTGDIHIRWDPALFNPGRTSSGEAGVTDFRTAWNLSGVHVASVTVRISSHLATGGSSGVGEVPVLLHELGHAVGLGHYNGPVVMNPLDRGFTRYQAGDLAGLTALYHPRTCPPG
jgi:hypothetical protein